eukprot:406669-Prorocentrum_minimum.AAC.1
MSTTTTSALRAALPPPWCYCSALPEKATPPDHPPSPRVAPAQSRRAPTNQNQQNVIFQEQYTPGAVWMSKGAVWMLRGELWMVRGAAWMLRGAAPGKSARSFELSLAAATAVDEQAALERQHSAVQCGC